MNTRKARDPKVDPSRQDNDRALAAAMLAVWDEDTIKAVLSAVRSDARLGEAFSDRYDVPAIRRNVCRLNMVDSFLSGVLEASVFLRQD
jgi:hypothetical protein